ncbi:MAG TPA: hypothetical protein VH592_01345 [Gemmataceae bacterium]|jgi:hypothetical protein
MGKRLGRVLILAVVFCVVGAGSACNKSKKDEAVGQGMENGGGPPPGMFGGRGGQRGPIHQAMTKLFRGQPSLKDSIGQELTSDSPAWETIQPQAKEFADLAASLKNYDPPKGSKESWTKQATSFSESASALERAAKAKNKKDALDAHAKLSDNQTCKACHQEHKGGPGGMGRGFRGRGGPPSQPQ